MEAARTIREAVAQVAAVRRTAGSDPLLGQALGVVKRLQSRRFAGTYADLLRSRTYAAGARFFLDELYGERDYAQRDEQFARIAGAIERLFPEKIGATAACLAQVHALTEDLDLALARAWLVSAGPDPARYGAAWRLAGRAPDRLQQLQAVVDLGHDLARLTRTPGLRMMLRMMRKPATAAGLAALQAFLEGGFDTFAGMARERGAVESFLATVWEREQHLSQLLFHAEPATAAAELARILGQAP
jgi:hypothetical protein